MNVRVLADARSLGLAAAAQAAYTLRDLLRQKGSARILVATGASQFEFLEALSAASEIQWSLVEMFHLEEYQGLPVTHPPSFRKYLEERLIQKTGIVKHRFLSGGSDAPPVMESVGRELLSAPIDLAFVGIGESGHLVFNEPPQTLTARIRIWS